MKAEGLDSALVRSLRLLSLHLLLNISDAQLARVLSPVRRTFFAKQTLRLHIRPSYPRVVRGVFFQSFGHVLPLIHSELEVFRFEFFDDRQVELFEYQG